MRKATSATALIIALSPAIGCADSPAAPQRDYFVCSNNKAHCAAVTKRNGVQIFRVEARYPQRAMAQLPDWYPDSYLSDHGRHFVAVVTTLVPTPTFDQPVIHIWSDAKLIRSLAVRDFAPERSLIKTTSAYTWGHAKGFIDNTTFVLELADGKEVAVNIGDKVTVGPR